jgi:hypothetical protein
MLRYQVTKTVETEEGTQTVPVKIITIADDARGADQYMALKKRGFKLQRLDYQPMEDR